jgi:hypothetical protein
VFDFITKADVDRQTKQKLNIMQMEKQRETVKKIEQEIKDSEYFHRGAKLPFSRKLREARVRNIKLTPQEQKLVKIRGHFDEIQRMENKMAYWLRSLKKKHSKKKVKKAINSSKIDKSDDYSPSSKRDLSSIRRRLHLREASILKSNRKLSMIVHRTLPVLKSPSKSQCSIKHVKVPSSVGIKMAKNSLNSSREG